MIPIYTFGFDLSAVSGANSVYRDEAKLLALYGQLPEATLNPEATYFDQTDVYRLQQLAVMAGKRRIILFVFDGMDWFSTWAAAIYRSGRVGYREGRGAGLGFQDYRGTLTDFGYFVTSPHNDGTECDVDGQVLKNPGGLTAGGYDWQRAGETPWARAADIGYPIAKSLERKQAYTDSASSATSMTSGIKTYNDAINVDIQGHQVLPIARQLQEQGFGVGIVTSVPISHATPAAAYANNVHRDDYQDLTRDLVGLPSIAHRETPPPGVDVLLGAGWGVTAEVDEAQGSNFVAGNRYVTADDLARIDRNNEGPYRVVERSPAVGGRRALARAAADAAAQGERLFGLFGVPSGHLPFRTANGDFQPTASVKAPAEQYTPADIAENPTLADMAEAALEVLETNDRGFWLMIEAGDVDWANHKNNLDDSIGAIQSGDEAFFAVTDWVERHGGWDDTAVFLTADHGHYFFLDKPERLLADE
ncbi:MAG TPA: alkaline phosphatase [Pirellulales bacterium]|nr:alkaline phosphatase [Pirellulales bacterium]